MIPLKNKKNCPVKIRTKEIPQIAFDLKTVYFI